MPANPSRRPEISLLCHCVRRDHTGRGPDADVPIDWDTFTAEADAHSVAERLASPLRRARPDAPQAAIERFETRFCQVAAENLSRLSQLAGILDRFQKDGVRALTFKGPVMTAELFGHLGMRCSSDLDILVSPGMASRVRALMLKDGYTLPGRRRHRGGSLLHGLYRSAGRDDTYLPQNPCLAAVDVHVAFAFWTQGIRLDANSVLDRGVTIDVAGRKFSTPCPEDVLLILAVHGMMHGWSSLRAVSDVDAAIGRIGDWEAVIRRARRARMFRVLLVALLMAREVLETELPPSVQRLAEEDRQSRAVAASAVAMLFDHPRPGEFDPGTWHVSFLDGPYDKCRYHVRRLTYEWFLKWPWDEWLGRRKGTGAPTRA